MRILLLLMLSCLTIAGCSSATPISLKNSSGGNLEDVVLSGSGFETHIANIAPNAAVQIEVRPKGESGLGLAFTSNGHKVVLPEQDYFEGGGAYVVSVVVTPALTAEINVTIR